MLLVIYRVTLLLKLAALALASFSFKPLCNIIMGVERWGGKAPP